MKKTIKCLGIIAFAAVLTMTAYGDDRTNPFIGEWAGVDSDGDDMTMTFTAATWKMSWPDLPGQEDLVGTYTHTGKSAALTDIDDSDGTAAINGSTLTFNMINWPLTGTLTKSSLK